MSALRDVYGKIPGGSCAIVVEGGASKLNMACPRLRDDLCLAWADLAQAFLEARKTGEAHSIKKSAVERYGCPAAPFQTVLPDGPVFWGSKAKWPIDNRPHSRKSPATH